MNRCLLGVVDLPRLNIKKIKTWARSFQKYSNSKIYLGILNPESQDIKVIKDLDINPIPLKFNKDRNFMYKRFKYLYQILNNLNEDFVLFTDVFDVVFQNNPFCKLNNYEIYLSGEGLRIREEPWNLNSINILFPNIEETFLDTEIICGGIIAGNINKIKTTFLNIYNSSENLSKNFPMKDQAALMHLNFYTNLKSKIFSVKDLWAINLCISQNPLYKKINKPKINNLGLITTGDGQIYDIAHQYNKIEDWANIIQKKYE